MIAPRPTRWNKLLGRSAVQLWSLPQAINTPTLVFIPSSTIKRNNYNDYILGFNVTLCIMFITCTQTCELK